MLCQSPPGSQKRGGHYHDKPEIIAAHSSPVMVDVASSAFHSAADALTILEQIEGALAYQVLEPNRSICQQRQTRAAPSSPAWNLQSPVRIPEGSTSKTRGIAEFSRVRRRLGGNSPHPQTEWRWVESGANSSLLSVP